jgi:hypothetical protein
MDLQLHHLIDVLQLPSVTMQILPFGAGEHRFLGGSPALLEFRETTHLDVVYLEGLASDLYEEQHSEVARYRAECERLSTGRRDQRPGGSSSKKSEETGAAPRERRRTRASSARTHTPT